MRVNEDQLQRSALLAQIKERLVRFFQQPLVKKSVNVLVPGVLAAILFPIFGPIVSVPAATIAIHNSLKLLGISMSDETIKKLLKLVEGKQIDESDLLDILQDVLPSDKQTNEDSAKALVTVMPIVKEAALSNPKLNTTWLGNSLESNLRDQGETMAIIADKIKGIVQLNDSQLQIITQEMLLNWTHITQNITVSGSGEVNNSSQSIKGRSGDLKQTINASEQGKVLGSSQSIDLS